MIKSTPRKQDLNYEIVAPRVSEEDLTAITSSSCQLDHFGRAFDIRPAEAEMAQTSWVGLRLERAALSRFKAHRIDLRPTDVRGELRL